MYFTLIRDSYLRFKNEMSEIESNNNNYFILIIDVMRKLLTWINYVLFIRSL